MIGLPKLPVGRPTATAKQKYDRDVMEFCNDLQELASRVDFRVSARGWGYVLEGDGVIDKDDIDAAERLINACRKNGNLPRDICADDSKRATENLEDLDDPDPKEQARIVVRYADRAENHYIPFSFWDDQEFYVQMMVEKSDLKSLFSETCAEFRVPIANWGGWADLNVRGDFMERFAEREAEGKQCVLLACLDFDPGGLNISNFIRSNLEEMAHSVGWSPDDLIIDRFGLNYDFIKRNKLVWINNLITGNTGKWKGVGLDDPRHPDHEKPYVQDYLKKYGVRKVEANALLRVPTIARAMCRQAILKYVPAHAPSRYDDALEEPREQMRREILRLLRRRRR
jgi:hypothetical protein